MIFWCIKIVWCCLSNGPRDPPTVQLTIHRYLLLDGGKLSLACVVGAWKYVVGERENGRTRSLQCRRFLWARNLRGGDGASQREQGGGGPDVACEQQTHFRSSLLSLLGGESIFLSRVEGRGSRVEGRGSRVEGSMSRARVPCRGSRVTFFFQFFFFGKGNNRCNQCH